MSTRYCDPFMPDTMMESVCISCGEPKADHPVELTRLDDGRSISVAYKKRLEDTEAFHKKLMFYFMGEFNWKLQKIYDEELRSMICDQKTLDQLQEWCNS